MNINSPAINLINFPPTTVVPCIRPPSESERYRDRQRETETERETGRQTNRQRQGEIELSRRREKDTQMYLLTCTRLQQQKQQTAIDFQYSEMGCPAPQCNDVARGRCGLIST